MKIIITASLLLIVILFSCNKGSNNKLLQTPEEVKADEYEINIDRDTVLQTKNGALLKIPSGSLSSSSSTVTLEIKEAYSITQMIRSGLTTQSNGQLLSSGGMIYINPKKGQEVKINKAIKVAIPTENLEAGMQLFKGKTGEDGKINWSEPDTLPENKQLNSIMAGKQLFLSNCASCHAIGKNVTGADLANILKRPHLRDKESRWPQMHTGIAARFQTLIPSDDATDETRTTKYSKSGLYACLVKGIMGGSAAPLFPDLNDEALDAIYNYIQNESDRLHLPLPSHAYLDDCVDSCAEYVRQVWSLYEQKLKLEKKQDSLTHDNGRMVVEEKNLPKDSLSSRNFRVMDFDDKVSPKNYDARYYQFTIETFGWFNIDVLLDKKEGVKESQLFVRVTGEFRSKVQVYLVIPSEKIYAPGGPADRNPEEFAFLYKNGNLPLPQNVKAYILAVSESESAVAFTVKEFTTSTQQEFTISLQSSSKEAFNLAMSKLDGEGIKITVADSKNSQTIRQADTTIRAINEDLKNAERLKPKNCDCGCGTDASLRSEALEQ